MLLLYLIAMGIAITEQQGVICLILRLLKKHQLILVGGRDFYSIHLLFGLKDYCQKHLYLCISKK